jgi:hypothetical protein
VTHLVKITSLSLLFSIEVAVPTNWSKVTHFAVYIGCFAVCWYKAPNTFRFPLPVFWFSAFLLRLLAANPICMFCVSGYDSY